MDYLYIIVFASIVIVWLVVKTAKQSVKLDESKQVIQKAGVALAMVEKELEEKDRLIREQALQIGEHEKREKLLLERIQRLRDDLKKRTEQYNYLVDFAREHNII